MHPHLHYSKQKHLLWSHLAKALRDLKLVILRAEEWRGKVGEVHQLIIKGQINNNNENLFPHSLKFVENPRQTYYHELKPNRSYQNLMLLMDYLPVSELCCSL